MSSRRGWGAPLGRLTRVRPNDYLPEGALAIGAGLMAAGITAYGFLILSARSLGVDRKSVV
jgi:hypothetical protein